MKKMKIVSRLGLCGVILVIFNFIFLAPKIVSAAADICGNPYFPLRPGDEIEYKNTGVGEESYYTLKVLESEQDGVVKIRYEFGDERGVTVDQDLFCDDGRIRTNTYVNLSSGQGGVEMTSDTEGVEGDLMPKDIKVGSVWTTKYTMATKFQGADVPAGFGGMKMTIKSENKVLSEEKITIPAGTYTALKVEVTSSIDVAMPEMKVPGYSGSEIKFPVSSASSMTFYEWWAKGVGLVKVTSTGAGGKWETVATRASVSGLPFLDNPTVEAIAEKGVAPAAAAVAVANSALAAQATLSVDIFRYLSFFLSQPVLMIKRRKRKAWGTVYNSLSRLPEDLVIVRLRDEVSGKIISSEVTDKAGRFSFLVPAGKYRLEAMKANFVFPSVFAKDKKEDIQYLDVYHGETIEVGAEGAVITPNIPIDPAGKDLADAALVKKDRWHKIQGYVALIGPLLGLVSYIIKPSWLVGLLFLLGIIVYLFFRRFATVKAPKSWGIIKETGEVAVPGAVLRIFAEEYNKLIDSRVSDNRGRYNFQVGNSQFYLTVTKDGYEKKKTELFDFTKSSEPEIIANDIQIKKLT
jgi:hypothetical protein